MHKWKSGAMATAAIWALAALGPVAKAELNKDAGTSAFPFLKVAQTARLVALGGASVADASDAAALQINPAGLAQQRWRTWSASYSNLYTDVQSGFVTYSQPAGEDAVLGLALTYLSSSGIPKRDAANNDLGTFGFSDLAVAVSAGARLAGGPDTLAAELRRRLRQREWKLDAGVSVRGIYEKLDGFGAGGLGADLGLLAHLPDDRTRVGLSLTNLGKQTSAFIDLKDPMPTSVQLGFRHQLREAPLLVVGDLIAPTDNKIRFGVGGELSLGATKSRPAPLALRVGFNTQGRDLKTTADDSGIAGFSFGTGLKYQQFAVDYAFTPGLGLGALHRFTISGNLK